MDATKSAIFLLGLLGFVAMGTAQAEGVFNVRTYGTRGDGKTLETAAIQEAINACAAVGGGQVLFPPGHYLSATINLRSHVTLKLDAGATLIGCPDPEAYRHFTPAAEMPEAKFSSRWHRALILGDDVEDVALVGPGAIDGNKVFDPKGEEKQRGPHTILLGRSRNIIIRDLTIRDSANYAILLERCSQVDVRQVRVTGGWDGFHFRGTPMHPCRDVTVSGCEFYTGDDAIAGRYWEDVLITGCVLNSSCNAVRLIGPAKHLMIHGCLIFGPGRYEHRTSQRRNTLAGLSLQPGAWDRTEGDLDDVLISDVTMRNVAAPFFFLLKPGNRGGRITVNRVNATGVYLTASSVESWAQTPFERVIFRDVSIECNGNGRLPKDDVRVRSPRVDPRPLPAWGFYVRGVKELRFENVRLTTLADDARSAIQAENVTALALEGVRIPRTDKTAAPLVLTRVDELRTGDTDWTVLSPRVAKLEFLPSGNNQQITAGRPFTVRASVVNGPREGLGKIELKMAGRKWTNRVWLHANEERDVTFAELSVAAPGRHDVIVGGLKETVIVREQP